MDLLFRIVVGIQTFLRWLLTPFFRCSRKRQKSLPKISSNILTFSATALARKIRQKELTCTEVTKAYIERIQLLNPYLNAVVEDRFTAALEDAENFDKIIANNELDDEYMATKFPLFGVPLTVKESCCLKGVSFCVGSKKRLGIKAELDGEAVHRLREAGAIPLLVSNTPELACWWESTNLVTGRTLNPYDINCTSGGSSGGEGALLGCGASVIGVGSDIAGSIRLPAMFNGVFGCKPTPKVISIVGHCPNSPDKGFPEYLAIGPITRFAEDLKVMTKIMSGEPECLNLDEKVDISKLNVFFMYKAEKSIVTTSVDDEIISLMDKCLNYLKHHCNLNISDYKFDMKNTCQMSASVMYKMDDIPNVLRDPINGKINGNVYWEIIKAAFGCSEYSLQGLTFYFLQKTNIFVSRSKYEYYLTKAKHLKNDFLEKLNNSGVFLYPTFPIPAMRHNDIFFKTSSVMYTMVFNVLGLPAVHVPLGINRNGLPIGIQVIAAPYQERLCFAIAEELEKAFGGWRAP